MTNLDYEDILETAQSGRAIRPYGPYRIQIGNDRLEYQPVLIDSPNPTGLRILEAMKVHPVDEYILFQVLCTGMLEELRLDEATDLRSKGVEKFLVFKNDRLFRFELDGRIYEWGATYITGLTLKKLAGVDPTTYGVWLEVRGSDDRPIGNNELVDLSTSGVERFFTGIVQTTEGTSWLSSH